MPAEPALSPAVCSAEAAFLATSARNLAAGIANLAERGSALIQAAPLGTVPRTARGDLMLARNWLLSAADAYDQAAKTLLARERGESEVVP